MRDATPADYAAFARLFPLLGVPDPLPSSSHFERQMLPHTLVAEEGAHAVAYAHWRYYGATAHVVHIVVDVSARRRRVGAALMREMKRRFVEAGSTRWYLNVKRDNLAAIHLYERCGLAAESRGWSLRANWSDLLALPDASHATAFDPTRDEAAALATRLGVDADRLDVVRARAGNVFVALRDAGEGCAFAVFDPAFPGVYPLGVSAPAHARPLFEAIHPHARVAHTNVFVEGDSALAEVLLARGGDAHVRNRANGGSAREAVNVPARGSGGRSADLGVDTIRNILGLV